MTGDPDRGIDIDPTYLPERGVYVIQHDFEQDGRLSLSVLVALELIAQDDPDREAGRLFETIDPDGLDSLFAPGVPLPRRDEGELTFPIGDYEVTVRGDGRIEIRPL